MSTTGAAPPEISGYSYVGPLGSGGYSEVYLYEKQHPKMKVAVKVLTGEDLTDGARRQFMAEANAMAALADHPSIVQVFSADVTDDGRPYLMMKYYPNKNMSVRATEERFAVSDVLRIGIQISDAVETAHRVGILHRDIKPANILTGQFGAPGLTDFGIAATKGMDEDADAGGMSIPWAPPEVVFAMSDADERSDVYSLAATVWHLLVGRSPFVVPGGDNTQWALMHRIQETPVPPTGRADVPDSLERLLQQAMAKEPTRRPQSALAFARALQQVEQEQHCPVTQILVDQVDRMPVMHDDSHDDDAGATRQRPLQRVDPQVSRVPATPPRDAPTFIQDDDVRTRNAVSASRLIDGFPQQKQQTPGRGSRPREFGATAPELDGTVQRPVPTGVGSLPGKPESGSRASRLAVMVGVAVLAVSAAVVGVMLSSSPKPATNPPQSSATPDDGLSQDTPDASQEAVLGVPSIQVARVDVGHVRFRWTYGNPESNDSFRWRNVTLSGSATALESSAPTSGGVVTSPEITVPAAAGKAMCIQVQVVRQDGSQISDWSDPVCSS